MKYSAQEAEVAKRLGRMGSTQNGADHALKM